MPSPFDKSFTLGILGGGQLGRMLIQAAMKFDFRIHVLDPDREAPCSAFCNEFTWGRLTDFDAIYNFGRRVDLLTIEIENVNVDALEKLEAEGVVIHPHSNIIKTVQDKGAQKLFLKENNIPTANFDLIQSKQELRTIRCFFPMVQKLRRAGYDGRGVVKIASAEEIEKGFDQPSVVEQFVDVEKEISMLVARSAVGEMKVYPPVEMMFHPEANLVEFLLSPANIPPAIEDRAKEMAVEIARAFELVGLAAVEMFVLKDGTVLVNEIAPRPHNSGHHTIEANVTSQFEQHLRAILGLPLGSTQIKSPAVMVNLLGEEGHEGEARYEGLEEILSIEGASVHLYGKRTTKPFRKMGHVTILDSDIHRALEKARRIKHQLKVVA